MKKEELKINKFLVLCDNCDTPASWSLSKKIGWIGCASCITGESESFDPGDLIAVECINDFLKEFNSK